MAVVSWVSALAPWAWFPLLSLGLVVTFGHLLPLLSAGVAVWLLMATLATLVMWSLVRTYWRDPGAVPQAWRTWRGESARRPAVPEHAVVSVEWKMALKRRQEEVETQALKSIVEQGAQVQPVVLEYDTAETRGLSADQKARALRENGILVLSNQDAAEFLGDVTWKTLGDDKMQEHEPHVAIHMHQEKENHAKEECQKKPVRLSMDGDIFQKLASSIQWGNVTDPETQKALLAGISLNENANNNAEKKGKEDMVSLDLTPMSRMNQFDREISEEAENLGATFCEKHNCNNYRPPRTHHCSKCKRCVTRMDHHCIWIGRCVGEGNIKNFNLFLFYYILASSIFVLLSNIAFFYHGIHADSLLGVLHAMLYVVALISAAGLCPLLWSQLNNIWNNNTEMEKIFTSRDAITRYSKGSKFENMKLVFGKNILYWPIPN